MEICLQFEIVFIAVPQGLSLRFACERPQDRSSPGSLPEHFSSSFSSYNLVVLLLLFSNHPFIGKDSDTFFFLNYLKRRGSAGIIIIIISRKQKR